MPLICVHNATVGMEGGGLRLDQGRTSQDQKVGNKGTVGFWVKNTLGLPCGQLLEGYSARALR